MFYRLFILSNRSLNRFSLLPHASRRCNKSGVNYCTMSRNQHIPQCTIFELFSAELFFPLFFPILLSG